MKATTHLNPSGTSYVRLTSESGGLQTFISDYTIPLRSRKLALHRGAPYPFAIHASLGL